MTRKPVIIKAYQKSKMKEKNVLRMVREIVLMKLLKDDPSIVQVAPPPPPKHSHSTQQSHCHGFAFHHGRFFIEAMWVGEGGGGG